MNTDLKGRNRFWKSFIFAFSGIYHAFKTEKNLRFHFAASIIVTIFSIAFHLQLVEWLFVIICIFGMFSLELINTAIERIVDLASPAYHPLAKQAKDVAAAAVLCFAFMTIIIGCIIFIPKIVHFIRLYFG
ncbi:diacylglycerol kinase family protein [Heyndrickxia sporothermodurans]|uniref:Diacylglycerol kinase n=1 Tax=Heyndrickxia sporothermodurans TaxID=46224 RepID=A0A150LGV5_9BACI|nr:diacylglycerol kinase family protein [Heyndrickxia sporothermodurans]KYD11591.1 Diacylglycerol kinase [Heyndrickxia sporothermodurans]MEB6548058.1 diacylglycerol kinase family protein [Heyndrickxia sporothermodurans]MED3649170.1 diacylglycerol kinase family protein [Heyndrickxia sporothermodurans]MED3654488.1 diacylglycerol kinase family protein [Heyndrickxia sporothermodurans]MED3696707.1 diacylglycerol kinase family protein [Heyndrickxia sporothermodurans]